MNAKFNLRVGIDGRSSWLYSRITHRVARYCWEICQELSRELPKAQFFVYSPVEIELPVKNANWICRIEKTKMYAKLPAVLWTKYRCGMLASADNLDVFGISIFLATVAKADKNYSYCV